MQKLVLIGVCCYFFYGCSEDPLQKNEPTVMPATPGLTNVFRKACGENGSVKGFDYCVSENITQLKKSHIPVIRRKQFTAILKSCEENVYLEYEIMKVEMNGTTDLGCTFSSWKVTTSIENGKDTTLYGSSISFWVKQLDGTWKSLQGSNTSLQPKNSSS